MPIRLALNTSTIKPQPMLDKIRLAATAGFEGIELWINDLYEFVGQGGEIRDVESALADHGLVVPCTIALRQWGEATVEEYPLALEEAKRRMELAARLGAPYIVATPPRVSCDFDQIVARYKDLLELGRAVGIRPTFEYISFFRSVYRLDQAFELVERADDTDATLIVDAFHSWNSGSTLDDLAAIPGDRISHYHIDDAHPEKPPREQTDPDRVMLGGGPINLRAELGILQAKNYGGWISLELFNRDLWKREPLGVLQEGIRRMRELVAGND